MTSVLKDRIEKVTDNLLVKTNYTELELELDDETYRKLIYCQKKLNASMDEVIRLSILALDDEILR